MAGSVYNVSNSSYYLYTNQFYWTGSPDSYNRYYSYTYYVYQSGYLASDIVNVQNGIRPVISLSSSAKLSGSGTWNDVYTVS